MADNTVLNSGSGGDTIATDDIGGVKFGRSKIVLGADGVNDGDVAAGNPLPVSGTMTANAGTDLNTSALALESTQTAIRNALEIIDDWDELDRCKVNPIAGQAGVAGGAGLVSAATQRVVLAADAALPAGANVLGGVTQSGGWDIGNLATLSGGTVGHDAPDSGNPVKIGGRAVNAEIAALAADDRSDLLTDLAGKLIVRPHCNPENQLSGVADTSNTTDVAVIASPGASLRIYVTGLSIANGSATDAIVEIKSGSTVVWRTAAPQKGGSNISFDPPLQLAVNQPLNMASLTAAATIYFAANGYKGI